MSEDTKGFGNAQERAAFSGWIMLTHQIIKEGSLKMSCFRVLLCFLFPPLAVLDKGCGSIVITTFLTLVGWVPGIIAALVINTRVD